MFNFQPKDEDDFRKRQEISEPDETPLTEDELNEAMNAIMEEETPEEDDYASNLNARAIVEVSRMEDQFNARKQR